MENKIPCKSWFVLCELEPSSIHTLCTPCWWNMKSGKIKDFFSLFFLNGWTLAVPSSRQGNNSTVFHIDPFLTLAIIWPSLLVYGSSWPLLHEGNTASFSSLFPATESFSSSLLRLTLVTGGTKRNKNITNRFLKAAVKGCKEITWME